MTTVPEDATWVRFPRFVGDAVMQLPILRALRSVADTPLVVWGPARTVILVAGTHLADAVWPESDRRTAWALAGVLRRHRASRSVHFPKSLRPALAAFLARVPERLGVSESGAGLLNTHTAPFWKGSGTFLERYRGVLVQRWPNLPALPFAEYEAPVEVNRPREPYVCLLPGASNPAKAWEADHYRDLASLARKEGLLPVILGSPDESALGISVLNGAAGMNLCGATDLRQAAAWLSGSVGAVGNDSGLTHLAAACGTPTLALFGATDPRASTPFGPRVRVMRRHDVPCSPCMLRQCTVLGHPCLSGLAAPAVWAAMKPMLRAASMD